MSDDEAQVWHATTGQPVAPALRHPGHVTHAAFSPDGRRIVTASWDQTARVWDAARGVPVTPPLRHHSALWDVAFSPDGRRIVTATYDETARVWDAATGVPITPPLQRPDKVLDAGFHPYRRIAVLDAAFSPDGRRFVTVSIHGMQIRDAATGAPLTPLLSDSGGEDAVFSPDGRHLLTRSFDRVKVCDAIGAYYPWSKHLEFLPYPILKHSERVWHAAYSPDGRRIVTACGDQTARVWDADGGLPVTPPLQHHGEVRYAAFSPDGRCIVTASDDQTARLWDAVTGEPLSPPLRHYGKVLHAEFSPDGRHVVTASEDQTARVWDLPLDDRPCPDVQRLAQLLSGHRIDSNSGSVLLEPTDLQLWAVRTAWQALRGKYPGDFSASPQQVLGWHQREAQDAERVREWAAALPHLDDLIQAKPKQNPSSSSAPVSTPSWVTGPGPRLTLPRPSRCGQRTPDCALTSRRHNWRAATPTAIGKRVRRCSIVSAGPMTPRLPTPWPVPSRWFRMRGSIQPPACSWRRRHCGSDTAGHWESPSTAPASSTRR
jgi:WD40 repeat protein